jgi:hypothetical protein
MADHLSSLPVAQVARWYGRLAQSMASEQVDGAPALAPIFLQHWLDNRDPDSTFSFDPPAHLKESRYVRDVLVAHGRIFLSQQRAAGGRIVGVLPRLQGDGYRRWDLNSTLELDYHSLVEVGSGIMDLVRIQQSGTRAERDLLTALRGFQLHSRVWVEGRRDREASNIVHVNIHWWSAHITDRYDWNYREHFTVPNPDHGSTDADAVRPGDRQLTVEHINAKRLEDAGLAAPYDIRSHHWHVLDPLLGSAHATFTLKS